MNSYYDLSFCTDMDGDLASASDFAQRLNDEKYVVAPSRTAILLPDNQPKVKRIIEGLVLMVSGSPIAHQSYTQSEVHLAFGFLNFSQGFRDTVLALARQAGDMNLDSQAVNQAQKAVDYSSN